MCWKDRLAVLLLAFPVIGVAATLDASPSNYRAQLALLRPGDVLELVSGTYTQGLPLTGVAGAAATPIVIRGPEDRSAVFSARSCCNTVQLDGTSHVEIRNLTLDGLNLDGPFGVDSRGSSHHITLENLRIINHGAGQQTVGISTKGPAWNWVIRRNTIVGAGTGIYLGNSDGTQPFVAGIIENNLILDTVGYNLQIKHQLPRPTNVGLPTSPSKTIIRHNVFSKRNNASTGANARPNVLVGHFPLTGAGISDVYEIYGNFFHENPTEALFQGEGNLAIYDNLFVNSAGSAVSVQPQNDLPRSIAIFNNTVVASDSGIRVTGGASGTTQRIFGNAVHAASPIAGPNATDNATGTRADAAAVMVAPLADIGSLDLFPKTGALAGPSIDLALVASFTDSATDFNGQARTGRTRGAYEGDGVNPGWKLALAPKAVAGAPLSPAPTIPTVSLVANPSTVAIGAPSTLSWGATNATACSASGGWTGARVTAGSISVGAISSTTVYTLTCSGPGGDATSSATVTITPAPVVTLTSSHSTVVSGESVTLQWSADNATACNATGGWGGGKPTAGSETSPTISVSSTFGLTCSGVSGSSARSLTVSVSAPTTGNSSSPTAAISLR